MGIFKLKLQPNFDSLFFNHLATLSGAIHIYIVVCIVIYSNLCSALQLLCKVKTQIWLADHSSHFFLKRYPSCFSLPKTFRQHLQQLPGYKNQQLQTIDS